MSKTNLEKLHRTQAGIKSTIPMFIETAEWMSKTNLEKLHRTQAGIKSTIPMFIETAEELKEQLNITRFRLALEELEMETKALYKVNEKIMSACLFDV